MKITQAYAWLVAGVLAAGLNASYYDGGLQRVHEIVDRAEQNSAAVLTLASGHADHFLSEMRWLTAREQTASCPLSNLANTALARVRTRIERTQLAQGEPVRIELPRIQARLDRMQAMADREQARMDLNRARIEVQAARMRMPAVAFKTMVFSAPNVPANIECPRVRVSMPRLPRIRVPEIPMIDVEAGADGPI